MTTTMDTLAAPRWTTVRRMADQLTEVYSAPPIPALEIAESQGVDVVFAEFGSSADKVAGFCDFKSGKIYVNAEDITQRQTFTIAHELGHWLLHREFFERDPEAYSIFPRFQAVKESDPYEKEANHFAANLLVPMRLLKSVKDAPVSSLASAFAVSRTMMEIRLKNVR